VALGEEFEAVLTAAQDGEEWAFGVLYDQLNPALLRYFHSRVPTEAEDLAAETWLGVARRLRNFGGDEPAFRSWLFTIAHRRLADHLSAMRRRKTELADPADLARLSSPDDPEGESVENLSGREAARTIAMRLSPDQAEVVLLRLLGGLDVEAVAAIMGKRPGTVRVLQHRALRRLARELRPEGVTR
jgi:RNA polymerase sigma-70 factor (ECF subfamily)